MNECLPIQLSYNNVNFIVDPRIELLASIELISNYDSTFSLITKNDFKYKREMFEYFKAYKEHKAVWRRR